jgi:hypothetical protein
LNQRKYPKIFFEPVETMGSSINTALNTTIQTSTNDIFQSASNVCTARCSNTFENVNIVIGPGSKVGDVTITQQCQADALCTMKNQLDAISTQQLEAIQDAETAAPGQAALITWPGMSINSSVNFTTQVLSNSVTQVINNVCEANSEQLIRNVNVYIGGAEVGAIDFTQTGSAKAECAIENTASAKVSQTAASTQTAVSTSGSVLVLIMMIVAIAVIMIALAWIAAVSKKNQAKSNVELAQITAKEKTQLFETVQKGGYQVTSDQFEKLFGIAPLPTSAPSEVASEAT